MSSGVFAFGYVILSMIVFAGFAKIFTVVGPGKVILPAIVGVLALAIVNNLYLFKKGVDEICQNTETDAPVTETTTATTAPPVTETTTATTAPPVTTTATTAPPVTTTATTAPPVTTTATTAPPVTATTAPPVTATSALSIIATTIPPAVSTFVSSLV